MMVTYNLSFVFKGLRREKIRYFHIVSYFSIKVNSKFDVGGAKCNKNYNFRVQNMHFKSLGCKV